MKPSDQSAETSVFPVLYSERLVLRQTVVEDAPAIFLLRSDEEVSRFINRKRQEKPEEAISFISRITGALLAGESYYWAISHKEDPALLGTICIWNLSADRKTGELGYELLPRWQGKGIMSEAIGRIIEFAFGSIGLDRLEAYTHKDNERSTRLLRHHNFRLEPERKDPDSENITIYTLEAPR